MKRILSTKFILVLIILIASFLRLYKLSVNPPSLFGDEVDLGYQAYSILKTGRDYQGNFMPINFHSIAEWRTPLYLYSAVPTVAVFGITPLGVRLPAALFGILSVLLIFLLVKELLSYGQPPVDRHPRALLAAALMAVSPWSLQYSRAGFEVTEMLFFLMLGLFLFFKSLKNGKWLWLSVSCLVFMPWVYSTAKLFVPLLLIFLFITWRKEILKIPKRYKLCAVLSGLVVGLPLVYGIFFSGGSQRFNYINVFSDPTVEPTVGFARQIDARMRGESGVGLTPKLIDRIIHNKFTILGGRVVENYFRSFSSEFLFIKGDPNLRHSIGIGEFYKVEIISLLAGVVLFFTSKVNKRIKLLLGFWLIVGIIPAAITTGGGDHATRLILILPPLILLISYGVKEIFRISKPIGYVYLFFWLLGIGSYLHQYYVHYPWESERWWHYGWKQSITEIKSIDKDYDRVIISMSGEPAWIFFAGFYQFDPATWQKEFPIGHDVEVSGFGKVSHVQKYYFGAPDRSIQIYGLERYIDSKTLYLANAAEVGENLIMYPDKVPPGLKLIKTIVYPSIYPSGEPAFYIFTGEK